MKPTNPVIIGILVSLCIGYVYGAVSYKFNWFPASIARMLTAYIENNQLNSAGYRDTSDRLAVNCREIPKQSAVILAMGQSNSANHGETRYIPRHAFYNFNFFDGKCYRAIDPLLGASGDGGSVWSRLGDLLIEKKLFKDIVIAPIGVTATSIARWKPGGDLHGRIHTALTGLRAMDLEPTHILWHQGEADAMNQMNGGVYRNFLEQLLSHLRTSRVTAPIFIAVASMCHNAGSDAIRNAQIGAIKGNENVFFGANSDRLDSLKLRYDGCHFSTEGLRKHANLWLEAISYPKK